MCLENGYEMVSTFPMDFSIADKFGLAAVRDTFKRAFDEWKGNYIYLTELVIVLSWKIFEHYESNPELASLYNDLWIKADSYACENLKDEELLHFYRVTD